MADSRLVIAAKEFEVAQRNLEDAEEKLRIAQTYLDEMLTAMGDARDVLFALIEGERDDDQT